MKTSRQRSIMRLAAGLIPIAALARLINPADSVITIVSTCAGILSMSVLQVIMMDLIITIYKIGFSINNASKEILNSTKSDQQD